MSGLVTNEPPFDDAIVDELLKMEESYQYDCKRISNKLTSVIETVVAFANSDGGMIAIGLEDPDKADGRDRVYGIGPRRSAIPRPPHQDCPCYGATRCLEQPTG